MKNVGKSNQQLIKEGIDSGLSMHSPAEAVVRYERLSEELKAELQWLVFLEDRSKFETVKAAIFVLGELETEAERFIKAEV